MCLLKALAIAIGYVKVALLLMIASGDAWFEFFSEIMLFIPFHVFSRSLIFSLFILCFRSYMGVFHFDKF